MYAVDVKRAVSLGRSEAHQFILVAVILWRRCELDVSRCRSYSLRSSNSGV